MKDFNKEIIEFISVNNKIGIYQYYITDSQSQLVLIKEKEFHPILILGKREELVHLSATDPHMNQKILEEIKNVKIEKELINMLIEKNDKLNMIYEEKILDVV
jgi:hypothetical protein